MKHILYLVSFLCCVTCALAENAMVIAKVNASIRSEELTEAIKISLKATNSQGTIGEVIPISPVFGQYLESTIKPGDGFVQNYSIIGVEYLFPQNNQWLVRLIFADKGRVLEELTLNYPNGKSKVLKLGKPGENDVFSFSSPGVYSLFLDYQESPVFFKLKYSGVTNTKGEFQGEWPVLPRFYSIQILNFKGNIESVLKELGNKDRFANPIFLMDQVKNMNVALTTFGEASKNAPKENNSGPSGSPATEKPCVNCPQNTNNSKKGLGIFRR